MLPSSPMSEIDLLLSEVNVSLSKIDVMLSKCPNVNSSRSPVLPRIGNILSKMESIVAQHLFDTTPATDLSWDDAGHSMWYPDADDQDDNSIFSCFGGEVPEVNNNSANEEEEYVGSLGDGDGDNKEDVNDLISIADRVKARRNRLESVPIDAISNTTSAEKTSLSLSPKVIRNPRKKKKKGDPFLAAITRAIGKLAPKSVYNNVMGEKIKKERDERKVANVVPDVLRSMWESAESLWVESEVVRETIPDPYPTLDWSKVNKRFISNIPSPSKIPKHGCSLDPAFYQYTSRFITGTADNIKPKHQTESFPFGSEWGYRTSEGVVSVSSVVHHGYIWDESGCWILHATQPKDKGKRKDDEENNKFEFKRRKKKRELHLTELNTIK